MIIGPGIVSLINFFDRDEIDEIKSFVIATRMGYGTTAADGNAEERMEKKKTGSQHRMSKVFFIPRKATYVCEPFVKYDTAIEYVNKTYLHQPIMSHVDWEGYQYADYSEEYSGFYKPHRDSGGSDSIRSRLLSASLQLTDPDEYEGGDLVLYPKGLKGEKIYAPKQLGTITVFISSIIHEVTPVTKGLRNSLVTWVH